jgi:hypothetical protein
MNKIRFIIALVAIIVLVAGGIALNTQAALARPDSCVFCDCAYCFDQDCQSLENNCKGQICKDESGHYTTCWNWCCVW